MVKDHSDSERGNPLPPHRLLLSINSKGSFYMHHPTDKITHTTAFVTPGVENWLEREGSIRRPIAPLANAPYHGATSRSLNSILNKKNACSPCFCAALPAECTPALPYPT